MCGLNLPLLLVLMLVLLWPMQMQAGVLRVGNNSLQPDHAPHQSAWLLAHGNSKH